jgi:phosphoglycerate-specific signal transduction histidine kinase
MAEFLRIIKIRVEEKITKYKEKKSLFKTEIRRIKHVDVPLKRNQDYVSTLS